MNKMWRTITDSDPLRIGELMRILKIPIDQTDSGEYDCHYNETILEIEFPYTIVETELGRLRFEDVMHFSVTSEESPNVNLPDESNVLYQLSSRSVSIHYKKYVIWFWKGSKYEVECRGFRIDPPELMEGQ
jgi:hypothetical protein